MNKIRLIYIILIIFVANFISSFAQEPLGIPSVKIKNLKGETVDTKTFSNEDKPFLICFWATWCKPCILEQSTFHELYDKWQQETGIKIISVSIDDSRNSKKVAPFIKGRGWKFDIYLDENSDFKRAMNAGHPPHTFLVNAKGEIVWQHNGYAPGDEDELYEKIKELVVTNKQ